MHTAVFLALKLSSSVEDPEDHHVRPPGWDQLAHPGPEPQGLAPEYPLAVAFDPADPANFLANGIVSYDWVVVHTMQGSYSGTISWFKNPDAQVSTQYVMRSSDGEVTQMVLDKDRAYHVGSQNRYALGIEHEGFVDDPSQWYTWATYTSSARLTRWLTIKHDIPVDRDHIAGHSELPNQSHTDPGSGWNWTLYMALIREVVLPGEIRGVVVDRGAPCILIASTDTWLKRTAMPTDTLGAADRCSVGAGTQLAYWHARPDIDGHHYLYMPPGEGPCADMNGLDAEAYAIAGDWSALCPPEALAAVGATIQLDGGAAVPLAADGSFLVTAAAGAHTIDAHADGLYEPASEPVDLAVYPGARLVIALDPVPAPDPTGDPETTGDPTATTGDPTTTDPTGNPSNPTTDPTTATTSGDADAAGDADSGSDESTPTDPGGFPTPSTLPGLPADYGSDHDDPGACACNSPFTVGAAPSFLLPIALGLRRRRR